MLKFGQSFTPSITVHNFVCKHSWWMTEFIKTGYRRVVEMSDIFLLRPDEQADVVSERFRSNWKKQQKPSLLYTLHLTFGMRFYLAGLLKFLSDTAQLLSPFFVKLIIEHVSDPSSPSWIGYMYALALFIISFSGTIVMNQYLHVVCFTHVFLMSSYSCSYSNNNSSSFN